MTIRRQVDVGPVNPGSHEDWRVPVRGPDCYCPIVVLCDAPTVEAHRHGLPLDPGHHMWLAALLKEHGFQLGDVKLVGLCPPLPKEDRKSAARKWAHVERFRQRVLRKLDELAPLLVVTFGELATRMVTGRAVAITKARGVPVEREDAPPYFPMLSPGFVRRIPDHQPAFEADLSLLHRLKEARFDVSDFLHQEGDYEWVWNVATKDNGEFLEYLRNSTIMAVDTETQGGTRWWDDDVRLLSVQVCVRPGEAYVFPVCDDWCGHEHGRSQSSPCRITNRYGYHSNRLYLKELLENPDIRKVGHNIKFEHMMLRKVGIEVQGWLHDTQLMLFNVDENLMDKSLDMGVKVFVPELGGYADELSQNHDKSDMAAIPRDVFVRYSAGDADATLRLARRLKPMLDQDERHRNCYRRVQMPAILTFANTVELQGMAVDQDRLREFSRNLDAYLEETYRSLIERTPAAVKEAHLEAGHELKFSRPTFVRDVLFSEAGFGLVPRVFTESTEDLPEHLREPSTSVKTHLPYFTNDRRIIAGTGGTVGDYVNDLVGYQKATKMRSTYVGDESRVEVEEIQGNRIETHRPSTGFWKYLSPSSKIHPSYMLHRTNTGRSACVHEDTLIPTVAGQKRIADVGPGDWVWTHRGRWRRVARCYVKPPQEMYDVYFTNGEVLTCTEDHRILTRDQRWVSLRDVCLQEALGRSEHPEERGAPLSRILEDHERGGGRVGCGASHGQRDTEGRFAGRRISEVEGAEIFGIEGGQPQSDEGQEARKLQGAMPGWARLLDRGCPWREVFRASDRHGGDDRDSRGVIARKSRCAPHRRGPAEQRSGQSRLGDDAGARGDPREVQEVSAGIRIARVEPCGSYPVHDIEVEDDHSYECAGGFSHNSADPNGQNIPNRGSWAKQYKEIFVPSREGWSLVSCDLSQIELRLVAWMSGDPTMLDIYRRGGDIHALTASQVLGVPYETFMSWEGDETPLVDVAGQVRGVDSFLMSLQPGDRATATLHSFFKQKRFQAKAINFGFIYGMSAGGFQVYAKTEYGIDYAEQECWDIRGNYFGTYWGLPVWHRNMHQFVERHGYVRSLHGAVRHLPSIRSEDEAIRAAARRYAVNSPIQRFGSDLGVIAMNRFARQAPDTMRLNGFVHDALYLEARDDVAEEAAAALKWVMENPPLQEWFGIEPPLPLLADAEIGGAERKDIAAARPEWWDDDEVRMNAEYLAMNRSDLLQQAA